VETEPVEVHVEEDILDIVPEFLDNRKKDIEAILVGLGTRDFKIVREIGHRMKGSGSMYGLETISRTGALIEQAGKDRDRMTVMELCAELAEYLKNVRVIS